MTRPRSHPLDVVYIAGFGRSGSTLVERALGQLAGVTAMGEVRHLWQRSLVDDDRCGCGRPWSECPFWRAVLERSLGHPDAAEARTIADEARRVDRTRFVPSIALGAGTPAWLATLGRHVLRLGSLYRGVAEVSGTDWLVDASKEASHGFLAARVPGVRLHVLHLVRDARGVAYSWTRKKRRLDVEGREAYMVRRRPALTAWRWTYQNLSAEALRARATSYARVRYEDVVTDPASTLRAVLLRFGYPGDVGFEHVRGTTLHLDPSHAVSGNPMRFETSPVALHRDDAWMRELPPADARMVTRLTAPLLLRYGYPLAPPRAIDDASRQR